MKHPRTTAGRYSVEAVAKALEILDTFGNSEELTLNEINLRVGLNKSRVFRLLHTLAERGYVDRCADGLRYRLGIKLFERASFVRRDIRRLAQPRMRELHERFNETVNLGVLNGDDVLYIDILETTRPFRMMATVGGRMPARATSMGKAMLAHLETQALRRQSEPPEDLRRELELVRRRGYAVDNEENERGVACIGAAIFDVTGLPVAAISVSGPAHRILKQKRLIAQAVAAACRGVSGNLGFTGPEGRLSGMIA